MFDALEHVLDGAGLAQSTAPGPKPKAFEAMRYFLTRGGSAPESDLIGLLSWTDHGV